jgi:chromate reductase
MTIAIDRAGGWRDQTGRTIPKPASGFVELCAAPCCCRKDAGGLGAGIGTIRGIPLYDGDVEAAEGVPEPVTTFKDAIAAADGLLLVTPEYNNSIPGVFKNAIDWLSRPPADIQRVFGGKPVALMGASPGGFGTILSQNAWLAVLRTLGAELWCEGRLLVSRAQQVFDADGTLTDERIGEQLRTFMEGFVKFAHASLQRE